MTTCIAALSLVLTAAAGDGLGTPGKGGAARIAAVEKELCAAECPAVGPDASSDWLRSPEGQKANACHTACRLEQPASALFRSACEIASSTAPQETPLVRLAGQDGTELARRLRVALKEGESTRATPVCARARSTLGTVDEVAYLECVGRITRAAVGVTTITAPKGARALRCAMLYAERDADWLKRCPEMETAWVEACVDRVENATRPRRESPADVTGRCESEAVAKIAAFYRHRSRQ